MEAVRLLLGHSWATATWTQPTTLAEASLSFALQTLQQPAGHQAAASAPAALLLAVSPALRLGRPAPPATALQASTVSGDRGCAHAAARLATCPATAQPFPLRPWEPLASSVLWRRPLAVSALLPAANGGAVAFPGPARLVPFRGGGQRVKHQPRSLAAAGWTLRLGATPAEWQLLAPLGCRSPRSLPGSSVISWQERKTSRAGCWRSFGQPRPPNTVFGPSPSITNFVWL